jgi:hypothetical protein
MASAEFNDIERQSLILELDLLLEPPFGDYKLHPGQWAALWLCSLEGIKELIDAIKCEPSIKSVLENDSIRDIVLTVCTLLPMNTRFGA